MQEKIEIISNNRKAFYSYTIIDKYESGMILLGSEVKSLREKKLNLKDSFVTLKKNRFFLVNAHISPYSHTGIKGHEPTRDRELLLHKKEIKRLIGLTSTKGLTLIATKVFEQNGFIKIELALAKGKKNIDKRRKIIDKRIKKEIRDLK